MVAVQPGGGEDVPVHCSVAEAALLLGGCSQQTVRNLLEQGRLHGQRVARGRSPSRWQVERASIKSYLDRYGSPARPRQYGDGASGGHDREIEQRLQRLEEAVAPSTAQPDPVNLQFANLRLLQIQENYDRAIGLLLEADSYRRRAYDAITATTAEYRAIIEQFMLPQRPPAEPDLPSTTSEAQEP